VVNVPGFAACSGWSVPQSPSDEPTGASIRGERRIRWIEHAVALEAQELDERPIRRVVSALAPGLRACHGRVRRKEFPLSHLALTNAQAVVSSKSFLEAHGLAATMPQHHLSPGRTTLRTELASWPSIATR
jgi:hypothetical protein